MSLGTTKNGRSRKVLTLTLSRRERGPLAFLVAMRSRSGVRSGPAVVGEASRPATGDSIAIATRKPVPAWWQVLGSVVALLWAVGTALGLVRLGWGCVALARFCRRLHPLADPRQKLLVHRAADAVGLRKLPPVFLSRAAGVPVSIGLLRPAIVLPEAMPRQADEEQLQAVLLHEMAHIARHDHWVGVGQRLAAVLFWWNPLVHRVCDEISELREEICDNYVLLVQGEGRRLARILVDLAARATTVPLLPSTVGVLEPRLAGLTGRVSRLLDQERNMETRMNLRSRAFVFACGLAVLIGMATVGGLRLASAQPAAEKKPAAAKSSTPAPDAMKKSAERSSDHFDFRGQVLDPDGKPRPGAKIYLVFYTNHTHPKLPPPKVRAATGPDGQFHFTMDKSELDQWKSRHPWGILDDVSYRNDYRVVAQADGFGPVWQPAFVFDATGDFRNRLRAAHPDESEVLSRKAEPVLRVVKDDVPLLGRIVDTKGRPVAGVKIGVQPIMPVKGEDLTGWLAAAEKENADAVELMKYETCTYNVGGSFTDNGMSSEVLPQITPTATSDADGRFRLTGIGARAARDAPDRRSDDRVGMHGP